MIFCVTQRRLRECPNRVIVADPQESARCNRAKFAEGRPGNTAHPEPAQLRSRYGPGIVSQTGSPEQRSAMGAVLRSAIALFASSRRMISTAANGLSPSASVLIPQRARQLTQLSQFYCVRPW